MYNLIIKNNDFNAKIVNIETKEEKEINASIDIFNFKDIDTMAITSAFMILCNELYKGKYTQDYVLFFFSHITELPKFEIQYSTDNTKKQRNINFSSDILFKDKLGNFTFNSGYKKDLNKLLSDYKKSKIDIYTIYHCENECDIVKSCLFHFMRLEKTIKKCLNCNELFIPIFRNDTQYCDRESQTDKKTCKKINLYNIQKKSNRKEVNYLHKKNYNKILGKYGNDKELNSYMTDYYMWKDKLKNGSIKEKDYIKWLNSYCSSMKGDSVWQQ